MKNKVLNYKDWFRAVNESNLIEDWSNESNPFMEADVPVKTSVWGGKPMAKDEKYFRYWKGIMRSKVKFEITDVPMAKGGKYEATDDYYVTVLPSQAEGGKDTTTFNIYSGYGNYYVVKVGEAGRNNPLATLKSLLVNSKNLEQTGKYSFKKTGNKLEILHEAKNGEVKFSFDVLPKLMKGWNTPSIAWTKDNPFLNKDMYPTEESRIKAGNEFRAFVKAKFPNVAKELDLSAERKDSSAYGSKNIMNAWNYIMPESKFALGQIFISRGEPGFDKALSGSATEFNTWLGEVFSKKGSAPAEKMKDASIVYNIPGDKNYEYKVQDGSWFSRPKKGGDWKSLASNKAAVDKLNKEFPNANLA